MRASIQASINYLYYMIKNKTIPLVSVVVTTKNEEKNIDRCLELRLFS